MNLINSTLQPINSIVSGLSTGYDGLGSTQDKGCPETGKCAGCTPFCCADGGESRLYITQKNLGATGYAAAIAIAAVLASACGTPLLGLASGLAFTIGMSVENYVLKPVVDWINFSMNKSTQQAYAIQQSESRSKAVANMITASLQTRMPWCDIVSNLQTSYLFATNSPWFGSSGPKVGAAMLQAYMFTANELNNARFGRTYQKISQVGWIRKDLDEVKEAGILENMMWIKVPNIEHYWMDDTVLLPGRTIPVKIKHRFGSSLITTWDCDRVFHDQRIYPSGNHDSGRGCKLSYDINALAQPSSNPSMGGNKTGWNIRNLQGEGLLLLDLNYSSDQQSMVGKFVNLYNPIYINTQGQVFVPAPTVNIVAPPAAIPPPKAGLEPLAASKASFASSALSITAFVGIAMGFIYQSLKN